MRICLAGIFAGLSIGCGVSDKAPDTSGTFTLERYSNTKPGSINGEFDLSKDTALDAEVKKWLAKPRLMTLSLTDYVPKLVLRSDRTMVNFVGNTVVVSIRTSKDALWTQYTWIGDAEALSLRDKLLTVFDKQNEKSDK